MNTRKFTAIFCAVCLLAQLLAGCAPDAAEVSSAPDAVSASGTGTGTSPESDAPAGKAPEPAVSELPDDAPDPPDPPAGADTAASAAPDAAPAQTSAPAQTAAVSQAVTPGSTSPSNYRFGTYLGQSAAVDDSYFSNAVFLGDSRTEGLQYWSGIKTPTFYWKRGMSVFAVDSSSSTYRFSVNGQNVSLLGTLSQRQYEKVYILLGINEIASSVSSYESALSSFVDKVIAAQPNAVIYLQTNPPLNDTLAGSRLGAAFTNEKVNAFNAAVARVAAAKRVVLLDINGIYRDASGQLPADLSTDGCHFSSGSSYTLWASYLRTHTIDTALYHSLRNSSTPSAVPEDPTTSPAPAATPQPMPEPSPEPVPEPTPEPSADPAPEPTPEPGEEPVEPAEPGESSSEGPAED